MAVVGWALVIYTAVCILLAISQEALIFHRPHLDSESRRRWSRHEFTLQHEDVRLQGWWVERREARTDLVVVYYGGNAEEVSGNLEWVPRLDARAVLMVNYRGYGASSGAPTETGLYADALFVFDRILAERGVAPGRAVVMGRSLGSAVATHVAAHRPVGGAILITPLDSMVSVASGHYPFFPVRWLLRHRFDAAGQAPNIRAPMLALIARNDRIVPMANSKRLVSRWAGPHQAAVVDGVGHNTIHLVPAYWQHINRFLHAVSTAKK
jgi:pimeloyl-ACP methyl ester carboxylesterase